MRVIFVTSQDADYISSVLWDGLNEVLGPENVFDAIGSPILHPDGAMDPNKRIAQHPGATDNYLRDESEFDLMVVNACVTRHRDWNWVNSLRSRLRLGGKIAFVDGDDGISPILPPFHADVYFKREIHPGNYPVKLKPMLMALPERFFQDLGNTRDIDVCHSGNLDCRNSADPRTSRWVAAGQILRTEKWHRSIVASASCLPYVHYHDYLHRSRVVTCCPGGGSDCLRQWEGIACGAIPIFVGHPPRVRHPWFDDDEIFAVENAGLSALLDDILDRDLEPMRHRLRERALAEHTTRARAEQLLNAI